MNSSPAAGWIHALLLALAGAALLIGGAHLGLTGTTNWGGLSFDAATQTIVANSTSFPWTMRLIPRAEVSAEIAANRHSN